MRKHCSEGVPTRVAVLSSVPTRAQIQFPVANRIEESRHRNRGWETAGGDTLATMFVPKKVGALGEAP
jgi:hypothetical protein